MRFSLTPPHPKMQSHVINGYQLSPLLWRFWIITTCNDFLQHLDSSGTQSLLSQGTQQGKWWKCGIDTGGSADLVSSVPRVNKKSGIFFMDLGVPLSYSGNYQEKELYLCCPSNLRVFYFFPDHNFSGQFFRYDNIHLCHLFGSHYSHIR